jgi:hypothetical protein
LRFALIERPSLPLACLGLSLLAADAFCWQADPYLFGAGLILGGGLFYAVWFGCLALRWWKRAVPLMPLASVGVLFLMSLAHAAAWALLGTVNWA